MPNKSPADETPNLISQLRISSDMETPRTRQYYYAGPATRKDLDEIQAMYTDMYNGRPASLSLIVRRSLGLLASHLRDIETDEEKYLELAALMQHRGN